MRCARGSLASGTPYKVQKHVVLVYCLHDVIPYEDRLDEPENLDLLSIFVCQVHKRLEGGLHYSL